MIKPGSDIYFAKCFTVDGVDMNCVKIGLSYDAVKRVEDVAITQPFECKIMATIPGDLFVESFLHYWFRSERIAGEYFRCTDEITSAARHIEETGELPFPVKIITGDFTFSKLDAAGYMKRKGITFQDIERHTGMQTNHYRKLLEKHKGGNRRFLAMLSVTAVRMGHSVTWCRDFKVATKGKVKAEDFMEQVA